MSSLKSAPCFVTAASLFLLTALPAFSADVFNMPAGQTSFQFVSVGDINNSNDPAAGRGSVSYAFAMGKFEVTAAQYAEFLNAVASTDTYGLYNSFMGTHENSASIARTGSVGSYSYSPIGSPNLPIVWVSWGDAARFANWLSNGQPVGAQCASTTEDGSYTLNGATSGASLAVVTRNPQSRYVIPTDDEWHKAAYYDPTPGAGGGDNYWAYPMRTDAIPHSAMPPGTGAPDSAYTGNFWQKDGIANTYDNGYAVTGNNTLTNTIMLNAVGAYNQAFSHYGAFDLGGNVSEWTQTLAPSGDRVYRGGSWSFVASNFLAQPGYSLQPSTSETPFTGFRIALVPEPASLFLLALGAGALLRRRGRRQNG